MRVFAPADSFYLAVAETKDMRPTFLKTQATNVYERWVGRKPFVLM